MLKQDIIKGGVYRLRWHDGSFTEVEILHERKHNVYGGYPYRVTGTKSRWAARNLKTGRIVEIKSAAKLRERVR